MFENWKEIDIENLQSRIGAHYIKDKLEEYQKKKLMGGKVR